MMQPIEPIKINIQRSDDEAYFKYVLEKYTNTGRFYGDLTRTNNDQTYQFNNINLSTIAQQFLSVNIQSILMDQIDAYNGEKPKALIDYWKNNCTKLTSTTAALKALSSSDIEATTIKSFDDFIKKKLHSIIKAETNPTNEDLAILYNDPALEKYKNLLETTGLNAWKIIWPKNTDDELKKISLQSYPILNTTFFTSHFTIKGQPANEQAKAPLNNTIFSKTNTIFTKKNDSSVSIESTTIIYCMQHTTDINEDPFYTFIKKNGESTTITNKELDDFSKTFKREDYKPICTIISNSTSTNPLRSKVESILVEYIPIEDLEFSPKVPLSKNPNALLDSLTIARQARQDPSGHPLYDPISTFIDKTIILLTNPDNNDQYIREINDYLINYKSLFNKKEIETLKKVQEMLKKGNHKLYQDHASEWHKRILLKEVDRMIRNGLNRCLSKNKWEMFLIIEKKDRERILAKTHPQKTIKHSQRIRDQQLQATAIATGHSESNTTWSRFKKNWAAGSVLTSDNKSSKGITPFFNNLVTPLVVTLLLPLQVLLSQAMQEKKPEKWWKTAARWGSNIIYTAAASAAMILLTPAAEVINIFVSAGMALFKKEPLPLNFYKEYAEFGEEKIINGTIYNLGMTIGDFFWSLPAKGIQLLTKTKPDPIVPLIQMDSIPEITFTEETTHTKPEHYLSNLPAYQHFKRNNPSLIFHQLTTGPAVGMRHNTIDKQTLRQSLLQECLLFLHAQAQAQAQLQTITSSQTRKIVTIEAVDQKTNLLKIKNEILIEAISAYNSVFSEGSVIFKVEAPSNSQGTVKPLNPEAVTFCQTLTVDNEHQQRLIRPSGSSSSTI